VTNIELDHPDHYQDLEEVIATFGVFASGCNLVIASIDCPTVQERLQPQISYSLNPETNADYTVTEVSYQATGTVAQVWEQGKLLGEIHLQLLGKHNLSNALAAVAVGRKLGLEFAVIAKAIATFTGAKRRFEEKGKCNGITLIDDYAHHPSEIRATLAAARLRVNQGTEQRVVAIFQPHRYSRTLSFLAEFATAFTDADLVIVTDIYSAGEANPGQISGQNVVEAIAAHNHQVIYHASLANLTPYLAEILKSGDLALFLGAGNLNQSIPHLIEQLSLVSAR
jgi:UDP-N-acetylmuramate--alanine ligase